MDNLYEITADKEQEVVVVGRPMNALFPDNARLFAAHLVAAADKIDPDPEVDFSNLLEAVKNT